MECELFFFFQKFSSFLLECFGFIDLELIFLFIIVKPELT